MDAVFNQEKALKRTMGDRQLLAELLDFTITDMDKQLDELRAAIDQTGLLKDAAHRLKGTAGAVGADRLYQSCFKLEQMALQEEVDLLEEQISQVCIHAEELQKNSQVLALMQES